MKFHINRTTEKALLITSSDHKQILWIGFRNKHSKRPRFGITYTSIGKNIINKGF